MMADDKYVDALWKKKELSSQWTIRNPYEITQTVLFEDVGIIKLAQLADFGCLRNFRDFSYTLQPSLASMNNNT